MSGVDVFCNNLKTNKIMTSDRIKEIQSKTAYPDSISVQQALLQVWNECEQCNEHKQERSYSEEEVRNLLQTQRGNCYVAILTKTRDTELASLATLAPEPGGKDGWVKRFKNK
jgi:hypothetical protein